VHARAGCAVDPDKDYRKSKLKNRKELARNK
jgi:hypothetical protein